MTREDIKDKQYEDVKDMLSEDIVTFGDEIGAIEDMEELSKREEAIVNELNEYDAFLNSTEYDLPTECVFGGVKRSKSAVADLIIYFLNKTEVEWSYTLGMYQLVEFWKDTKSTTIPYKVYDSTLRCLGNVKFKGYSEWRDILIINEYMSGCHNKYSIDTGWLYFLSSKHNTILDRMKALGGDPDSEQSE